MERDLLVTLITAAATSGAAWLVAGANRRRINSAERQLHAETEMIGDERVRGALQDAQTAEERSRYWSNGFYRLWHWVQAHWASNHEDDMLDLPARESFLDK